MADSKITALTSIGASTDPANDPLVLVDVSDTSMAATGTTKKVTLNQLLGASGTATLASATITGDLTVDTSTLKVDSANDAVGVGTATPASYAGSKLSVYSASNTLLTIAQATSYSNLQSNGYDCYINTNVGGANSNAGSFIIRHGSTFVDQLRIDSSGNITASIGNIALGTSGKGIDFSATANSSGTMTSELLNDYEEGTFTPTVIGATTAGVGTYTQQAGYYTKVGNLVTASVFLGWTAHTGTGNMYFAGLPFAASSSANSYSAASIAYVNNIALTASNVMTLLIPPGTSSLEVSQYPVGGGAATNVPVDVSGSIIYTVSYRV